MTKACRRLVVAFSLVTLPVCGLAASNNLSFTAHSLNLNTADYALLLAVDGQGNAYEVATVTDSSGRVWIRVTKSGAQGAVVATFQFGGTGTDTPVAMKVDAQGDVMIAGTTDSTDFPVTTSLVPAIQYPAAFVVKLDSALTGIIASTLLGGSRYAPSGPQCGTSADAMDLDSAGNIYLAGCTAAQDFPVTAGAYQMTPPGYDEFGAATFGFVAEITPDLNKIIFATYYGSNTVNCMGSTCVGAWGQTGFATLAVDPSGAILASGNVLLSVESAMTGSITVKFAPGGASVAWSTAINPSGPGSQDVNSLTLDGSGNVIVVGGASDGAAATAFAFQSCGSTYGGFVAKLSGASGAIQFLTGFGCGGTASTPTVKSVAVDASNTIWITGLADPSTLPGGPGILSSYLAALAPDGSSVEGLYTAFAAFNPKVGQPIGVFGQALALAPAGNPVVLGADGFLMLANSSGGPSLLGVANSAGSTASGLIAPAELVSFYGTGLGPATPLNAQIVNGVVQSTLDGYQLLIDGVPAPLLYLSANQINAVVPWGVWGDYSVPVTLVTPSGTFPLADLFVRPSEPAIFHDAVSFYAPAINQDGQLNSPSNPAHAGEIVSIWGTGSGLPICGDCNTDGAIIPGIDVLQYPALPVSLIANYGSPADGVTNSDSLEIDYAGPSPGEVFGLLQINFRLPQPLPYGIGPPSLEFDSLAVSLQVGSATSPPVLIYVAP